MQISESHRQLLITMLEYEMANFLRPQLDRAHRNYSASEATRLEVVKGYFEDRIQKLK